MAYRLSQKACEKQSNEKVVQFPNKEMINQNAAKEHPHLFTLTAILTCPGREFYMNFVLNTGDKTNQVTNDSPTTKENKIPQDKQLKKVVIYYWNNAQIERFEFFDKDGNSFFEAGRKGSDNAKLEVVLEDDECLMGIQAQEHNTGNPSLYSNMQLMIRKM